MNQREISEIMFHFHLDQAAAHMMSMCESIQLTREVKHDFNIVQKTMKRIWRKQDNELATMLDQFENLSIMLDEVLQLFLKAEDANTFLQEVRKLK